MYHMTPDMKIYKERIDRLDEDLKSTNIYLHGFGMNFEKEELNHVHMHIYNQTNYEGVKPNVLERADYFMVLGRVIFIVNLEDIPECKLIASLLPKKYRKVFFELEHHNHTTYGNSYASSSETEAEFYRKIISKKIVEVKET